MLSKLTLNRQSSDIYDPVVVVDKDNKFIGTITMKTIISRAFDTEIKFATSANPLTSLPGNMVINVWMDEILKNDEYSIAYIDLDRFKEYNDIYGFTSGDDMIKFVANHLRSHIEDKNPDYRLGHIGGDDFVIMSDSLIDEDFYKNICLDFDKKKEKFFSRKDLEAGSYFTKNRKGKFEKVPLVTLSIAVVTSKNFNTSVHSGKLSQSISLLKGKIKSVNKITGKSGVLIDRRVYNKF